MTPVSKLGIYMTVVLALSAMNLAAQSAPSQIMDAHPVSEYSSPLPAVHLIGLPEVAPSAAGTLELTADGLEFTTASNIRIAVPYNQMSGAFVGTDRTEAGGKAGSLARKLPYGAGIVVALASQKQRDLLTVEFQDPHGAYHGTVFALPSKTALVLQQTIAEHIQPLATMAAGACSAPNPNAVLLEPLQVRNGALPVEYRVLLYESVYRALNNSDTAITYVRPGGDSVGSSCVSRVLHLEVTNFTKGNQSLRAATGPVGFFVGLTTIRLQAMLEGPQKDILLDESFAKSKRGDSDSLKLTQDIAKVLGKHVAKGILKTQSSVQHA